MMKYVEPEMECIMFDAEDIIATSSFETLPESVTTGLTPIDPDEGVIV